MRFKNVYIEALACHLPDNIVTSDDIEKRLAPVYDRLKLPYGRLEMMTGIKERRFWNPGTSPSQVSSIAGKLAIVNSGINQEDIGCLINASVCRDFLEPATAALVHHNLGLPKNTLVYDISNACLGVLNGMINIANMIELGQIQAGLVVAGENGGPLVDSTIESLLNNPSLTRSEIKASFASLTIASAAVGVVLVHKDLTQNKHRLLGGYSQAASQFNNLCRGNDDSKTQIDNWLPLMKTDAETMMREGCGLAGQTWDHTKNILEWVNDDVNHVFCHQVGHGHRKLLYETLSLELEKDFSTLEYLGNTGAASLPSTLALGAEKGLLESGDRIALLGIGSGLNSLMLGVEW
ncbi:MAG: 3-oxoacyl-ACP synthase III [Nitrospina sp.]|nr:3-oxoacyl-ACP synthase III [Nitrospina sp.]MBT5967957.1 3-oxoacyl-ACP synthase III [Nitrospina sp.]MBT6296137.1 3-oxoacyl-ACP synthase III [Nitrospina sp.]